MLTTTYADILAATISLAGQPIGKSPDAELIRLYARRHLAKLWNLEAWPELCLAFVAVTVASNQFTKSVTTYGDVLAIASGGNPNTTTAGITMVDEWVEGDGIVRLMDANAQATLYVEYQLPIATLPAYGASGLGATTLPQRFEFVLPALIAAQMVAEEDPIRAAQLRADAKADLAEQASRFSAPWWRKARMKL